MADDRYGNGTGGIEPYSPFVEQGQQQAARGKRMSLRGYSLALTGLVLLGFVVMAFEASMFSDVTFMLHVINNYMLYSIVCFAISIVGLIMMSIARRSQSVGLSLAGYGIFVASFGFTASLLVMMYDVQTISTAFLATAVIVAVFGCLGIAFPQFFQRIAGVLGGVLLALIVAQIVMMFIGADQTWIDLAVIVVFCGFIGYDFHMAMSVEPTLVNAVFAASNLFLDIINVFIRVLSLLGRRD